jgi:Flp pilus assembly protein TadB
LFWRIYYAIKKNNYLKASTLLIFTCSIFATILNIEGTNCITKINSSEMAATIAANEQKIDKTSQQQQLQQLQIVNQNQSSKEKKIESFKLVQYCFLVTNLYVYSLYGIVIGIIIIVAWYIKYRIIWSKRTKESGK